MENKTQTNNNEIDLFSVLQSIAKWIGKGISAFLKFLYRNFLWICLLVVLGGATGFLIGHFSKKYYQSSILMQSKNINCSLVIREIDALNEFFVQKKYDAIAKRLSISEKEAQLVKSISGIYAIDVNRDDYPDYADLTERYKKNPSDTAEKKMSDFFYVKMELYSKEVPELLPVSIKNFIGNNSFCQRENAFHLQQKQEKLKELKYQLSLLDSLQKTDYFKNVNNLAKGEQLFLVGDRGRPLFHQDYMKLYEEIQELELDLGLYSNEVITIMQDMPQPSLIPQNSTIGTMLIFMGWFLGFGFLGLIIKENRKAIIAFFKNKPTA